MNTTTPATTLPTQPPLAVVGLSALFPKAANTGEFWSNIRRGIDAITEIPDSHWNPDDYFDPNQKSPDMTYARRGGFLSPVPFDPLEYGISPNNLEAIDTSQLLGMVAAKRALEHAGYGAGRTFDRSRVGCILGVTGTLEMVIPLGARLGHPKWRKALKDAGVPDDVAEDVVQRISDSYVPWQENSFPGLLGNVVAGRIANRLDLHGTNCVVDAACASSLSAIHLAALELWTGRSDMIVTGGIDTFNDIFMFMCFSKTPALSPTGDAKPFSETADGTILGEGVGIVVLKRLADAERDGDRIYAVLKGIGTSSDGAGNAVYAPKAEGQIRCLQDAYRVAGVTPDTIELVEAHGTGTKVGDATEVSGLMQVYQSTGRRGPWCAVGSIKSQIGHTKAAAGAAGIIKAILALLHRVLPPTIKVSQPPAALLADDSPFYVNTEARPWLKPNGYPRRAAVSAFGFGGSNFHCVLEESPQTFDEPDWDGDVQVVALSALSLNELAKTLRSFREMETAVSRSAISRQPNSRSADSRSADSRQPNIRSSSPGIDSAVDWPVVRAAAHASRSSYRVEHPQRLLLVIERDKTNLAKLVEGALTMLDKYADRASWSTPDGAYYGRGPRAGALGVLFPGQGSQYVGMLRELACRFPAMNDVLAEANAVYSSTLNLQPSTIHRLSDFIYPIPSWTDEARARQDSELRATQIAQPAIGAVSLGALAVLEQFGVYPEAAAGHSYGELTALCASRRFAPKTLYRLSMLRGRLMAEAQEVDGGMLAIGAPLTQVEAAIREMAVDLVVANHNSPNQVVLSGRLPEIDRATELFSQRNLRGKKLQVAAAFHSPLVATASRAFRPELEDVEFAPSQMPVYANSTATEYPADPCDARDLLASQLARPVNFVHEIEQMYADGVRTFLEVGPGGVLTGLINSILSGREFRAIALDSSNGRRGGVFDLAHALAQLSASGHSIRLEAWDPRTGDMAEAPSNRLRIPICGANYVKPRTPLPPRPPMNAPVVRTESPQSPLVSRLEPLTGNSRGNGHAPAAIESPPAVNLMPPVPRPMPPAPRPMPAPPTPIAAVSAPASSPLNTSTKRDNPSGPARLSGALSSDALSSNAVATIQDHLRILQRMQEETSRIHQQFLESQAAALRTFEELARRQLDLTLRQGRPASTFNESSVVAPRLEHASLPEPVLAPVPRPFIPLLSDMARAPAEPSVVNRGTPGPAADLRPVAVPQPAFAPAPVIAPAPAITRAAAITPAVPSPLTATVLAVVSEKTGYPTEMLSLGMSLDHDLGIDSIKRVEILSALQERVPNLPAFKPEELGSLHTLSDVVTLAESRVPGVEWRVASGEWREPELPLMVGGQITAHVPEPIAHIPQPSTPNAQPSALTAMVLAVVSEKTGYPTEMLSLGMSLDHDLGIDSIKRVEILSALQERVPNLPAFKPEELGSLHTLSDVVALAESRVTSVEWRVASDECRVPELPLMVGGQISEHVPEPAARVSQPSAVNAQSVTVNAQPSALTATVLSVVSEKTGYPTEMLNLGMSLDHDLGIDSIKRVEILSALQERVPNLPAFKPEELGSLHTLSDVVALAEARNSERRASNSPTGPTPSAGVGAFVGQTASPSALSPQPSAASTVRDRALTPGSFCSQPTTLVRGVVRAEPLPPASASPELPIIRGAEIWITEDGLELSLRIAAELSQRGFKPRVVNLEEPFVSTVPERLAGLIIVAPADGTQDRQLWRAIEWLQKAGPVLRRAAAFGTSVFATVSRLDGRFGFEANQRLADPLSGGLAGLAKSAAREWPELNCKAIDLAVWPSASDAAVRVVDELFRAGPVEIGLSPRGRCTPTVVDESLDNFRAGAPAIQPGELVIVSGGARGVTAAAALAAAQAWRPRLVILGRSPVPPEEPDWLKRLSSEVEIKQGLIESLPRGTLPKAIEAQYRQILSGREVSSTLSRLHAAGVPVSYHAVDIRDLATLRPLLLQLQEQYGPVRGVIHGAGVLADQHIEDKTREQFDRVYQTKVSGLRNLLGAIQPDKLRTLCLFSSYTARYGRVGQCDYAIANEVLNKLARQFSIEHPRTHVVSFNWGPWDGGMVTGGLKKLFAAEHVGLIPMIDGANLLVQELSQSSSLPVEVLVIGKTEAPVAVADSITANDRRVAPVANGAAGSVAAQTARVEGTVSEPVERRGSSNILLAGHPAADRSLHPTRPPEHLSGSSNVLLSTDMVPKPRPSAPVPVRQQGSSNVLLSGVTPERPKEQPPAQQPGPSGSWVFAEIGQTNSADAGELKIAFERTLNVKQYPFLESHVIGGKAVMPVAMMLEWLAHGTIHHNPGLELEGFDDFRVFHGVRLDRHDNLLLRVMVGKAVRTGGRFIARTQLVGSSGGRDVVHAAGSIILTSHPAAAPDPQLQVALRGYSLDMATAYATKLFHGSHLQGIAAVEACSPDGIIVDSRTSPAPWAWMREPLRNAWIADPLSIDAALQAVILWSQEIHGIPCLPCSIGGYRQFRKVFPHTGVKIVVQVTQATEHTIRADVEFLDLQGQVVALMTGCESIADASLVAAFQRNRLD